jgi:hypothetical protein
MPLWRCFWPRSAAQQQADGRIRYWGWVPRLRPWRRVVALEDGKTVHNAFSDREFKP